MKSKINARAIVALTITASFAALTGCASQPQRSQMQQASNPQVEEYIGTGSHIRRKRGVYTLTAEQWKANVRSQPNAGDAGRVR